MTPTSSSVALPSIALKSAFQRLDRESCEPLVKAKIRGLLRGYDVMWRNQKYQTLQVEIFTTAPLINPETRQPSRSFEIAGKKDVVVLDERMRRGIVDHKTCSEDISGDAPYWQHLRIESQPSHYMWLDWVNGEKNEFCVWDVVRKPQISPKLLTKSDLAEFRRTWQYCGFEISSGPDAEGRESMEMYEARLAQDCTFIRPSHYFARRMINRLDQEIYEYAQELWENGQEILHVRREDRWTRHASACFNYNRPCRYLGICSGNDTPDSRNWKSKDFVHAEIPTNEVTQKHIATQGKKLLTNSRVRTFQLCRRKHFYDYELGIERVDAEREEALYFGDLWHKAMENWWLSYQPGLNQPGSHTATETERMDAVAATSVASDTVSA